MASTDDAGSGAAKQASQAGRSAASPLRGAGALARSAAARASARTRAPKASGWRPRRWRVVLWCLEFAVLLAVFEAFVLRPRQTRRAAAAASEPAPVPGGTPVAVLGAAAQPLPGLREVAEARLPSVDLLAPGSETMLRAQVSYAAASRLPVEVRNTIGMTFRLVPPGTALIGSPEGEPGRGDMELQHVAVVHAAFYMAAHEVTQDQWSQVMPENPSHFHGGSRPVEEVAWHDCQRFLNRLCALEGVPEGTYRLPTESEWEYACRAGTSTAYHFGDDPRRLGTFAEYAGNNYHGPKPVGGKPPNALGLFNMHGNVWEWCLNRFAPYPGDMRELPAQHRDWRSIRGGNWYVPAADCRSAERSRLPPASKGNMLGFRAVRAIVESRLETAPPGVGEAARE